MEQNSSVPSSEVVADHASSDTPLKRTPLFASHQRHGGKLVPFAGWELPVQFSGLIAEHVAVRNGCGIFDVSHMGEIRVTGVGAERFLNQLTLNDLTKLYDGKGQYSAFPNASGGVIDDIIIYRVSAKEFFICVNASNADKDYAWLLENQKRPSNSGNGNVLKEGSDVVVANLSNDYGQIAVQGPQAIEVLYALTGDERVRNTKPFHFFDGSFSCSEGKVDEVVVPVRFARTGYTGEDGYELFVPAVFTEQIWEHLAAHQAVTLCGLGARDTLRLEASYPLHGHELSEEYSALESGLGWITKFDKGDFIGREILLGQQEQGVKRKLVGLELNSPGIIRHGDVVKSASGETIGIVTSGTKTPTLNKSIGMAIINVEFAALGQILKVEVRGRQLDSSVVKLPLYKRVQA